MRKLYSIILAGILGIFGFTSANAQYCTVSGGSSSWRGISIVSTTGATANFYNATSNRPQAYFNYSGTQSATVTAGRSFNIRVTADWGSSVYIDFNGDNQFAANELVGSTGPTSIGPYTNMYSVSVPANAAIGNTRIRVTQGLSSGNSPPGPCGFNSYRGQTEDYNLNIQPPPAFDAASELAQPTICPGTNDFEVRITNWGSNTLTSVTVGGTFGATTYGPTVIQNMSLATGEDTVVSIGTYTAVAGTNYSVTTSSSLPSGQADQNTSNDNSSSTLAPALKGTFTLGGASPDYNTFASAWSDLLANGVCDTTIFNIRSGNYNEQLWLRGVNGADLTNAPIIFQSDPANTAAPVINYTSSWMIYATGARAVIVKGLELNAASNTRYRVYLNGNNSDLVFDGNTIEGYNSTSTSTSYSIFYSNNSTDRNVSIVNNNINRGSYVLYARGSSTTSRSSGWRFDNNTLDNWILYGVFGIYADFVSVSGNTINTSAYPSASTTYGIYLEYSDNTIMEENNIDNGSSINYGYGLYAAYTNDAIIRKNSLKINTTSTSQWATSFSLYCNRGTNMEVYDNYAELYGSGYGYGMYFYYNDRSTINANEVNIACTGGTSTTYGVYYGYPQGTSNDPLIFSNNMVYQTAVSTSTLYGIYMWGTAQNLELIHNSVNVLLGNTNTRSLYTTFSGSNNNIRNNVFVNQGPGDAVYISNRTSNARDNNCYYSNGARTGYIQTAFTDVASLQAISTGDDQNSLIYMPDFVANDDLHMFFDKTLDQAGSSAATIVPEDFDGDQRDPVTPDIGLDEYVVPRNSVALIGIDAPVTPICALSGLYDIDILNVGTGNLTTFNVDGEVRHLGGGSTTLPTFTYTGNLNPNAGTQFNAGNYSTGFVNGDTLILWVNNPNGVTDSINIDDTLRVALTEGIKGVFTVGDTTGGNPNGYDYATLAETQQLLDSVGAICDTVVFELADGTYAEALNLIELIGTAPDRPVIYRGMNGDASLVTIRSGASATVTLAGGDNYHFKDLTIRNTTSGSATLRMNGGNDNIIVDACVLENTTSNTSINGSAISGDANGQDNLMIVNSEISGGSHNIYLDGSSSNRNDDVIIENNTLEDAYYRGLYISYAEGFAINYNEITSTSSFTNGEGIYIDQSIGSMEVMYNKLMNFGVWPIRAIRFQNTSSLSSNYAKLANNEMHVGTGSSGNSFYGFYMDNTSFMDMNHNTVALEGFSTNGAAVYINGGGANELRNNNFAHFGNGRALEVYSTYALTYSDHNNLFTNGAQLGRFDSQNSADFATWQTNTGLDVNSVSVDPMFYSMSDLRVCAADLDGAGIGTYISTDIQGQSRSVGTPDIGADEFTAPSNFSLPNDTNICKGDAIVLDGNLNQGSFAIWNNFQPSQTITINQAGTYRVFVSNVCGQAIDSITITENAPATLPNDTHICASASLNLDPQVANGAYVWSTGSNASTISVNARGIYAVEVTDADGCVTTDSIAVTQSRAVSLPADTSFCAGNTYAVNANVGQGSYFWSPTGQTGPVAFIQTSGNYVVNYVDGFGCQSTDGIMVTVLDEPLAQFNYNNIYRTVQFNDQSIDATSYLWVFGDGDSSTVANPVHVYPNGVKKYRVQLFVSNDCGEDVFEDVVSIGALPGFEENLEAGQFNVFPNPNGGVFSITMNADDSDYTLEVLSMEGKVIYMESLDNVQPGINKHEVSLDGIATGVYFVRVSGENVSNIQKINIH